MEPTGGSTPPPTRTCDLGPMKCQPRTARTDIRTASNPTSVHVRTVNRGANTAAVPLDVTKYAPGYFAKIRDICDRHDILFIADEVLTGMGRTGKWLAIEREEVTPDILTLGKGLSGGYAPLSALVVRDEIVDAIAQTSGAFSFNQTFSHTPMAAAAGLSTIQYLQEHELVTRSAQMGVYFLEQLQSLRTSEIVGDVRGIGLLAGVEYVVNRDTKEPFPPELKIAERVRKAAFEERLILWSTARYLPSNNGDLSVLGPPFVITKDQVDELVKRLKSAIVTIEENL